MTSLITADNRELKFRVIRQTANTRQLRKIVQYQGIKSK
jgi:hypothetical protein